MTRAMWKERDETVSPTAQSPSLYLSDAAGTLRDAVMKALDYSAQKMGLNGPQKAIENLQCGDAATRSYCYYSLAQQVGRVFGTLDGEIRSVYLYEYGATPDDPTPGMESSIPSLHLLVWTRRKTHALGSLADALDRELRQQVAQVADLPWPQHLLDVQLIDDGEVEKRLGLGGLLFSLHNKPLQVWAENC